MNDHSEQFIHELSRIRMNDAEQERMGGVIRALAATHASPSRLWFMRHATATFAVVAIVAFGGVTVSANSARPDDALYGFRLQVNDRIEAAFTRDDDEWLDVQMRQIERQLNDEDGAPDDAFEEFEQEKSHEEIEEADDDQIPDDEDVEIDDATDDGDEQEALIGRSRKSDSNDDEELREAQRIERDLGEEEAQAQRFY
ncbi:MAG: hypothetical protein IT406_02220 [Candidatus Yanofskybacteria bacterium]|nr:hypothetical protein [Candidatus Yanofskybacteria bacterium]